MMILQCICVLCGPNFGSRGRAQKANSIAQENKTVVPHAAHPIIVDANAPCAVFRNKYGISFMRYR